MLPAYGDKIVVIRSKRKGSRRQTRRFVVTMTMDEENRHWTTRSWPRRRIWLTNGLAGGQKNESYTT